MAEAGDQSPKTPEVPIVIKRFSQETRTKLEQEGYKILELKGKSIRVLRTEGLKTSSRQPDADPGDEVASRLSEVALKPDSLFLPGEKNVFASQQRAIEKFSLQLEASMPSVRATMGNVADYAGIFHQDNNLVPVGDYIRTTTDIETNLPLPPGSQENQGIVVGQWPRGTFSITNWDKTDAGDAIGIVPLIVPK